MRSPWNRNQIYSNPKSVVKICRGSATPTPRAYPSQGGATTGGLPLQELHKSFRIAIAVVRIDPGAYRDHHPNPSEILLLIEVSYSTLQIDRRKKAPIYSRANIPEYWILDVAVCEAYIYRNPAPGGYQSEIVVADNAGIRILAFPEIEISFSELFLPVKLVF